MKSIMVTIAPEETRMALVKNGVLEAFEVERSSHSHLVGNIYKGQVQNVLPGYKNVAENTAYTYRAENTGANNKRCHRVERTEGDDAYITAWAQCSLDADSSLYRYVAPDN